MNVLTHELSRCVFLRLNSSTHYADQQHSLLNSTRPASTSTSLLSLRRPLTRSSWAIRASQAMGTSSALASTQPLVCARSFLTGTTHLLAIWSSHWHRDFLSLMPLPHSTLDTSGLFDDLHRFHETIFRSFTSPDLSNTINGRSRVGMAWAHHLHLLRVSALQGNQNGSGLVSGKYKTPTIATCLYARLAALHFTQDIDRNSAFHSFLQIII
ncbi:hypothetical protein C8F01DRAFT_1145251 [Mycena amicta]|nr:hypothetical protein C8F01DRAFT_1145251 [Mycena amicta]